MLRAIVTAAAIVSVSCGGVVLKDTAINPSAIDVAQLWQNPTDLPTRDLFHGAGGESLAPDASVPFELVAEDTSGYSPGFDVRDARRTSWSVKLGPEAQTEVVVSRILWAVGYHQPPAYYVAKWELSGRRSGPQRGGRFRPEVESWQPAGEWSWYENDFLRTPAFRQLLVVNTLLNNWDWKTSNNRVYEVKDASSPRRVYVVRDLGASLGKTGYPVLFRWLKTDRIAQGNRDDLEGFEGQGFIRSVSGDRITFDYHGIHQRLLETVNREDVVRATELLNRLTDAQLGDAFRAGGYPADIRSRYVAKVRAKIAEGLKLRE